MADSGLEIAVDDTLCIGSGTCLQLAPGVFVLDERGVAVVADPSMADEQSILRAARSCPSDAIVVGSSKGEVTQGT
jgi:ferredoxin